MTRFTEEEKSRHVKEYLRSGLSLVEYSRGNGFHPASLRRWKKQFGPPSREAVGFVEIRPPESGEPKTCGACIEIRTGDLSIRCLLYTSPSPRDRTRSRMPSSA